MGPIVRARSSPGHRGRASVRPISRPLGIAAALRARQVSGKGQRVTTSLLQGALAATCLNWQRVENPDAPLYWMWPVDSRSIEGLYECADGRWVHHWTIRPRWVLTAAAGDQLDEVPLEDIYRDDPDRVSMESDGLLTGIFLHPMLVDAFKKFPAADWEKAAEAAGVGLTVVRSPAEALADEAFLADGCVVEVEDPDGGTHPPRRPASRLLGDPRRGERTFCPTRGTHRCRPRKLAAWTEARAHWSVRSRIRSWRIRYKGCECSISAWVLPGRSPVGCSLTSAPT